MSVPKATGEAVPLVLVRPISPIIPSMTFAAIDLRKPILAFEHLPSQMRMNMGTCTDNEPRCPHSPRNRQSFTRLGRRN